MKKKIFIALASMFFLIQIQAQRSPDNIFRQYQNDKGVMYLDMGSDFARFLDEGNGITSKVEAVKVMVFSKGQNMAEADLKELKKSLNSLPYEMLIQAKHEGGKAHLYVIDEGDYFKEIFCIIQSDEYNVFARVYGEIYYEDLAKLDMNLAGKTNFGDIFGK